MSHYTFDTPDPIDISVVVSSADVGGTSVHTRPGADVQLKQR